MATERPEIGAALNHVCFTSSDCDRLSAFFERCYAMQRARSDAGWICRAGQRQVLMIPGEDQKVSYYAFGFATGDALNRYRAMLIQRGVVLLENPSPLFDAQAFAVDDPDGNRVVFGLVDAAANVQPDELPGRLQHIGFRTTQIEALETYYSTQLGMVISDRVLKPDGTLSATFLRSDPEHHCLALFRASVTRLDHHSYETTNTVNVVAWADHLARERVPIFWGVGRHGPGNDVFFMVKDPDDNLVEISAELEVCTVKRATNVWPHGERTLNLWGKAIERA